MSLGDLDLSAGDLKELAGYLNQFSSIDDDAEQYWYLLARTLMKRHRNKYKYDERFFVTVSQAEDKAALVFLKDLSKIGIELEELVNCLEIVKCRKAVNFFQKGATTPEIVKEPGPGSGQLKILKVGDSLCLSVEARCSPGPLVYRWFCNRVPLLEAKTPNLIIRNITIAHKGRYCCRVTNPSINDPNVATVFSKAVEVIVHGNEPSNGIIRQETVKLSPPPVITRQPRDVEIPRGTAETVAFTCIAEQGVIYDWYKDGEHLKNCSIGRLELNPVTPSDAGVYYCDVCNDGGKETSSKATLSFVSDIVITSQSPVHQKLRVNEKLNLNCVAASPSASSLSYEWFRMDRGKMTVSVSKLQEFSNLVTRDSVTSKRELQFCCKVTDLTDSSNFTHSKPITIKVQTVWIVEEPHDVHAVLKQRAQLTCIGEGHGDLKYVWLKSSTREGRPNFHKRTECGVLPFDNLSNLDAGFYQCQVENGLEHVDSTVVQVKPLLAHAVTASQRQPRLTITRQPRSCVVQEGARFRLLCEVLCSNSDPITYQWYFSGSKITGADSKAYIRERTQVKDCGSYWCEARVGSSSVLSLPARVELQWEETVAPGTNWQRKEGERFFRTKSEERFAREKIALLIGNCVYENGDLRQLNTPENDIMALQDVLRSDPLNFKVFSLVNLSHADMQSALEMFYGLLKVPGTYALFYFSGHGFSTNSHNNFLVPVDSPPNSASCFQVDSITRKMQDTLSRAILVLDACKVVTDETHSMGGSPYASIGSLSNMCEEWSCVDNTTAADGADPDATSEFNRSFINAIAEKRSLHDVHQKILNDFLSTSVDQRPVFRTGMSDGSITLHDPIMIDDPELEDKLDHVLRDYHRAHAIPGPVEFSGADMRELNSFAELKLSFSSVLTNTMRVEAQLRPINEDKTSSASVNFDKRFLESQGVLCSQSDPVPEEHELCSQASLLVRGLQKLRSPLKLLMKVCLWESGGEVCANLTYNFKDLPFIAQKSS